MKKLLTELNEEKLQMLINKKRIPMSRNNEDYQALERKVHINEERNIEVVKGNTKISIKEAKEVGKKLTDVFYTCHYKWLNKQNDIFFIEERIEKRKARIYKNNLVEDEETENTKMFSDEQIYEEKEERSSFYYDRLAAVQYAERWWNSHNSKYKNFGDNCTNFISQCLHAGNASMRGYPNRSSGWWMQSNDWSYSWTVANSMRLFLGSSKTGLRAKEVSTAEELMPGDVICLDFQGDGRYDHTTIVVAKDQNNMPLVNAQSYNSRMRYWSYEDSTAYTPNIKYKFYHIVDDTTKK
ncbi:amidase domain-containing protein [Metabacillus herbersteinensis]|uniref:Amidase domain-containing protein n=1 Tax=Metabacillus herbersteinensis TaxID=283816 RepID=A0ABV6GES9_9BACI